MSDTVSTGKNCIKMNVNLFIFFFILKTHAITQMFIIHFCLHYIIRKGLILSLYKKLEQVPMIESQANLLLAVVTHTHEDI